MKCALTETLLPKTLDVAFKASINQKLSQDEMTEAKNKMESKTYATLENSKSIWKIEQRILWVCAKGNMEKNAIEMQ